MEFYYKYEKVVQEVFKCCKDNFYTYPSQFREISIHLLNKINPEKSKNNNYICYLLPFWLNEKLLKDINIAKKLALANIYKMLCVTIQDKIIDSCDTDKYNQLLPLANLFFIEFIKIYQELFDSNSVIWVYLKKSFEEFAISVDYEKGNSILDTDNMLKADLNILAQKSAPLKITMYAVCLLSNRMNNIDNLDKQINYVLITLQLLDDWIDKYKDYQERNLTYVLNDIMKFNLIKDFSLLTKEHINRAAFFSDIPNRIYDIALIHKNKIFDLSQEVEVASLIDFHDKLIEEITDILLDISNRKENILKGGFSNLISKN